MPYIPKVDRERILYDKPYWVWPHPHNVGELNFVITKLIVEYLGNVPHYEQYNAVVGVLECAKLEIYRRLIAVYEDLKMHENGDVF